MLIKIVFLIAITAFQAIAGTKKCRALALSGGSNNGAWEAGVIWGLLHYGSPEDFAWDVNTGVSAGSINTGMIATWETGDEFEMSEKLSESWASIDKESEIFTTWGPPTIGSIVKALF